MQPDSGSRLVAALPWLVEPADVPGPESQVVAPAPEVSLPALRRRRSLAVLGAVGLLAGGFAITAAEPSPPASGTSTMPEPTTHDEWAARAQVTLASVQGQLEEIARAELALNRLPEARKAIIPVAAQRLKERKALLERRKATIQSQLDSYRALDEAKSELDKSEHDLESVEKAYGESAGRTSADDAELAALNEQRDLRIRQRDAKRDELEVLEDNVANAARTPLPADGEETAEISDDVLAAVDQGSDHSKVGSDDEDDEPAPDPTPTLPEIVGGREQEAPEREDTGISGPPDPRGPGDDTKEQDAGAQGRKGPLKEIVDGVGEALRDAAGTGPAEEIDDLFGKGGSADDAADGTESRRSDGGLLGEVGDLLDGDPSADRSERETAWDVGSSRDDDPRGGRSRDSDRDDGSGRDGSDWGSSDWGSSARVGPDQGSPDRDDADRDDADRDGGSDRDDADRDGGSDRDDADRDGGSDRGGPDWGGSIRDGLDRGDSDRDDAGRYASGRDDAGRDDAGRDGSGWGGTERDESDPDDSDHGDAKSDDRSSHSRGSDGASETYDVLKSLFGGSGDRNGDDHRDQDSEADEHEADEHRAEDHHNSRGSDDNSADGDNDDNSDDEHIERSNDEHSADGGSDRWGSEGDRGDHRDADQDSDGGSDEAGHGDEAGDEAGDEWRERGSDDNRGEQDDDNSWKYEEDAGSDHWERSGGDHDDQDGEHRGDVDDADEGDESHESDD